MSPRGPGMRDEVSVARSLSLPLALAFLLGTVCLGCPRRGSAVSAPAAATPVQTQTIAPAAAQPAPTGTDSMTQTVDVGDGHSEDDGGGGNPRTTTQGAKPGGKTPAGNPANSLTRKKSR